MAESPKILGTEDDEDDYVLTRQVLVEAYGSEFELDWAASAEAGSQALRAGAHDVYLVDQNLSVVNRPRHRARSRRARLPGPSFY